MTNEYTPDLVDLLPGQVARADDVNERYTNTVAGFDRLPNPKSGERGFSDPVPVGTPVNADHATTKDWVETSMTSQVNQAAASASAASTSELNASASEANALASEQAAATSESNAATSESNAATSESNAATSASNAATSESNAATSETNAATYRDTALGYRNNAATSATNANNSAVAAAASASAANTSASNAAASETLAEKWATEAEDVPVTTGKYSSFHWAQKAQDTAQSIGPASGITATDITNWDEAYSWGDHSQAGYLTAQSDNQTLSWNGTTGVLSISGGNSQDLDGRYLQSFTETDPTVPSHVKSITTTEKSNWNTAYGWGNHASAGYQPAGNYIVRDSSELANPDARTTDFRRVAPNAANPTNTYYGMATFGNNSNVVGQIAVHFQTGESYTRAYNSSWSAWRRNWSDSDFTSTNVSNWNTAFSWGNHASAGYQPAGSYYTRGGTTYSGTYSVLVGVSATSAYEHGSLTFTGSTGTLTTVNLDISGNLLVDSGNGISNSGNWTRLTTPSGYIEFGPANTTWAHIYTDRANFYLNKDMYVLGNRMFHDGYHPNADKWTTARTNTVTLTGDVTGSGSVSVDGSGDWTVSLTTAVGNDTHTHDTRYPLLSQVSWDGTAYQTGTTTAALVSWLNTTAGVHARKTGWSYAGNGDLTDAGNFTETAGTVFQTWSDGTYHTTLAIAPNTGGSAYRTMIYNDQGSSYSPGWREILTDKTYNSFVPSLTGTGASGTWGINIDGNAATATSATSAGDASTLGGASASTSASNNTIVKRNSSGYVFANYFNTTPNDVSSGVTKVCVETGNDGYIRHGTAAAIATFISGQTMNISGSSTSCTGESARAKGLNRSDTVSDTYNLQFRWQADKTSYWSLRGYNNNTFHAHCWVGWAGTATTAESCSGNSATATTATNLSGGSVTAGGLITTVGNSAAFTSANDTTLSVRSSATNTAASMSFHRPGAYAVNLGLDTDNVFKLGGWSASTVKHSWDMSGNYTATGNVTAYSDERLKSDIRTIPDALEKVNAMRGAHFTKDEKPSTGVIAQEIQRVAPELVNDSGEYLSVAYGNITGYLIEAIKELTQKVESLEARLAAVTNTAE